MASLKDIKPSISELTWNEQISIHETIRISRYTPKKPPKQKKKKGLTKTVEKQISNMNIDELIELQKRIEEAQQNAS